MMHRNTFRGFTLIEVIIVIALVGLLATAMITIINPLQQFKKARDVERKSDVRQMQAALELYRSDVGSYPAALPTTCDTALAANGVTYLQKVPCDPKDTTTRYTYSLNGAGYNLTACLEDANQQPVGTGTCATGRVVFTVTNP